MRTTTTTTKMTGGGGSNFRSITRLETLATEANQGQFPYCSGYEARQVMKNYEKSDQFP